MDKVYHNSTVVNKTFFLFLLIKKGEPDWSFQEW
jgi:hypothetical protein